MSDARAVAAAVLARIDDHGAYANLALRAELDRCNLDKRDRAFVTALVDGTTRMRRACDHAVDRYVQRDVDGAVRRVLRLGAYQLLWLATPPHAAVSATVSIAPRKARGFVNAVLRRVADDPLDPDDPTAWPDEATRLSYPDWIVDQVPTEVLVAMNVPAPATERADGYVQDAASQAVVDKVGARAGELVVDVCAAPGGKATAMARDATVIAFDHTPNRVSLIVENARRTASAVRAAVADGRAVPLRDGCADAVLVDAPCSGLGSLRRRADARWRVDAEAPTRLAALQRELLLDASRLVRPGGRLIYSVCTLTAAETSDVTGRFSSQHPEFVGEEQLLWPTADGRDGMYVWISARP